MLYNPVKVVVASNQYEKLKSEIDKKKQLSVKIQLKNINDTPSHTLLLTRGQIATIEKARAGGKRRFKTIRMSRNQIEKNRTYQGGFLSLLSGLASRALPALAKGLASGLLSGVLNGGDGLYLFRKGHCIKVDAVKGNGLYLRAHPASHGTLGDGLYLKRGNAIQDGNGIVFGANSPFKNIPILNWIL